VGDWSDIRAVEAIQVETGNGVLERFLRYVKIDTQSDLKSNSYPSTEKQKNLGMLLVQELHDIGIKDAFLNEFGLVYATIPSNVDHECPVVFYCAHMDTSPDYTGENVNPVIHHNYTGGDLVLPKGNIIIRPEEHPDLQAQIGNTIITADGSTLLGADNKAGVAEIMEMAAYLMAHPEVQHGKIRLLFTPDEEIGRGVDRVDVGLLAADFGYTIDGESRGHIETETFSADGAVVTFTGVPSHPGFAKDKMRNAIKMAADFVSKLPRDTGSPESTSGKEGFVHPTGISGNMESARVDLIIRDFTTEGLNERADMIQRLAKLVAAEYPGTSFSVNITEQYRNMKLILDEHPEVVWYAQEAVRLAGMIPVTSSIRGGTDGSRLSYMGLPCPNIFAGEHAFHSPYEWVSLEDMQLVVSTLVHLSALVAQRRESAEN
jgi:tripeptide aminopeptidase